MVTGGHRDSGREVGMAGVAMGNGGVGSGISAPKEGFPLCLRCWGLLGHPWVPVWGRRLGAVESGMPWGPPCHGTIVRNPCRAQGSVSPSPGGPPPHPPLPPGCRRSQRRMEPCPPVTSALVLQRDLTPTAKLDAWVSPGGFAGDEGVLLGCGDGDRDTGSRWSSDPQCQNGSWGLVRWGNPHAGGAPAPLGTARLCPVTPVAKSHTRQRGLIRAQEPRRHPLRWLRHRVRPLW